MPFATAILKILPLQKAYKLAERSRIQYAGVCHNQDLGPALIVYPTDKLAEFPSENRIEPIIYKSPVLAETYNKRASEKLELQFMDMYANPIVLAVERTKTFHNRKIVKISTPTLKLGNIWQP